MDSFLHRRHTIHQPCCPFILPITASFHFLPACILLSSNLIDTVQNMKFQSFRDRAVLISFWFLFCLLLMYNNALNAENSNLLGFFILSEKDITSGEMSMGIKSNTQRCYGYCNGASQQPSSFPPDPLSLQIFLLAHPLKPPTTSIFSNPVYYSLSPTGLVHTPR